jgi:hypothetical protein
MSLHPLLYALLEITYLSYLKITFVLEAPEIVPDHYVPDFSKRPLITTSLLKSLIWSLPPWYNMFPVWIIPGGLQFLYVMSLHHNIP